MSEQDKNNGWFENGLELIPFGVKLDAVAHFLGGLCRQHSSESETGAEALLSKLQDENISGFGYEADE